MDNRLLERAYEYELGLFDKIMVHCTPTIEQVRDILKNGIIPRKMNCHDEPEFCVKNPDDVYLWYSIEDMTESYVHSGWTGGTYIILVLMHSWEVISHNSACTYRGVISPNRIIGVLKIDETVENRCLFKKLII